MVQIRVSLNRSEPCLLNHSESHPLNDPEQCPLNILESRLSIAQGRISLNGSESRLLYKSGLRLPYNSVLSEFSLCNS